MRILKQKHKYFLHVFTPALVGLTIYLLFRGSYIIDPKEEIFPFISSPHVPYWIMYNLTDGIWFYSFLSTIILVWNEKYSIHLILWLVISILICFLLELLQLYHFIPGTFDWYDMLAYFSAAFICYFNFCYTRNHLKLLKSIYHAKN